jgi:predicted RNA binding protein YcfA (HicA-like mRNA interferase family)
MSAWPSTRARRVLVALLRIGRVVKRHSGSHRTLSRAGWADFVFAFHQVLKTAKITIASGSAR